MTATPRRVIEHAVPAHLPEAMGRIWFDVHVHMKAKNGMPAKEEVFPCRGMTEAEPIRRTNAKLGHRVEIIQRCELFQSGGVA